MKSVKGNVLWSAMEFRQTRQYKQLVYILLKTSQKLNRALLLHYVATDRDGDSSNWTLDHFLHKHITQVRASTVGQSNENVFYPGWGVRTNLQQWNWHMFHFVLRNLCRHLPADIINGLDRLKYMLRDLWGGQINSLESYDRTVREILEIVDICTNITGNEGLMEVRRELNNIQHGLMEITDEFEPGNEMKRWHTDEKKLAERVTEIPTGNTVYVEKQHKFLVN